jgi:two-component system, chemotaxis family, chemotaxis protein CheY
VSGSSGQPLATGACVDAGPTLWRLATDKDLTRFVSSVRPRQMETSIPTTGPILVVDDDASIRDMVADVLRASGYWVREAADGAAALAAVEAERPALVLLDMLMPNVDGWEFARRIRGRARTPIVVLTAHRDPGRVAREIGAEDYVAKPFEIDRLLEAVATHAERSRN